jgi:hypothetical protein
MHARPQAAMRTLMGTELLALRSDEFDKRGWNSEALLLQAAPAKLMSECFAGCVSGSVLEKPMLYAGHEPADGSGHTGCSAYAALGICRVGWSQYTDLQP